MPETRWRIAILDSGLRDSDRAGLEAVALQRFVDIEGVVEECEPVEDVTGHGTAVAHIIASAPRNSATPLHCVPELLVAQILDEHGRCTPATVAAAVRWAVAKRANLIHLSLGLAQNRPVLANAVAEATGQSVTIVAASPARGVVSYPAGYPGVIRATGDARCDSEQISCLDPSEEIFGACVTHSTATDHLSRGASIGAAHLTRFIACRLRPSGKPDDIARGLRRLAIYVGRERKSPTASSQPRSSHVVISVDKQSS